MDGLILLDRAQKAGLAVRLDGEKLIIRGPRRAEPIARLLIEHKPAVMAALTPWGRLMNALAANFGSRRYGAIAMQLGSFTGFCMDKGDGRRLNASPSTN